MPAWREGERERKRERGKEREREREREGEGGGGQIKLVTKCHGKVCLTNTAFSSPSGDFLSLFASAYFSLIESRDCSCSVCVCVSRPEYNNHNACV